MSTVSGSVPNLINGISQQPFALRLASQAELQINGYSSTVEGLMKRPPTKHVKRLLNTLPPKAWVHIINRDVTERYIIIAVNGDLRVFDFGGNEKTVHFPNGKGYLISPNVNFGATTVADHTFFLNKDVTVYMSAETAPSRPPEALVYVRQGNYKTTYTIYLDSHVVTLTTSLTEADEIKTSWIAEQLAQQINAINSGAVYTATVYGSTLWIKRVDGGDFSIRTSDSLGDTAMLCITKHTQTFANLPERAVHGYQVSIENVPGNSRDNYYLQYDDSRTAGNKGVWIEIAKPGRAISFDAATMPHVLVREADGTFTFRQADWDKCEAGDEVTAPKPSFVGKKISDLFFYRNRLGLIADESVIFSRASQFFNFWRTTATDLLDTDPIDITTSHVKVSILRHAIPFNEALLLFSDQTQFMLGSDEVLTPATVSLDQVTEYESSDMVKPVGAGAYVYFCTRKGGYTGVREYYTDGQTRVNYANDITAHVPRYIEGNVFKLAASTNEDVLVALTDKHRNRIYVYKFYYSGQEKVQASWSHWEFDPEAEILNCEFIESTLWLVVKRGDGLHLERMDIEESTGDPGLDFVVHLDRRLTQESVESLHFDGTYTTFSLPYHLPNPNTLVIVSGPGNDGLPPGKVMPYQVENGVYKVEGNLAYFYAGVPYEMRYRFSPFLIRQDAPGGGRVANTEGRLQLRRALINYANSGYFRIEVTPRNRGTYKYVFTGRIIGSGNNIIGQVKVETGSFSFPILANNMQVTIDIVNDSHLPSRHLNLDWEALYSVRTTRMT